MPTKPKSRVSSKNTPQLTQFKFRWWYAVILVVVVAVIGVIVLRYSYAGGNTYTDYVNSVTSSGNRNSLYLRSSGKWEYNAAFGQFNFRYNGGPNGNNTPPWSVTCAHITSQGYKNGGVASHVGPGSAVTVNEYKTVWYDNTRGWNCN